MASARKRQEGKGSMKRVILHELKKELAFFGRKIIIFIRHKKGENMDEKKNKEITTPFHSSFQRWTHEVVIFNLLCGMKIGSFPGITCEDIKSIHSLIKHFFFQILR